MHLRPSAFCLSLVLCAYAAAAPPTETRGRCGTGTPAAVRAAALQRVDALRPQAPRDAPTPYSRLQNGIYVVSADDTLLSGDRPADLQSTSLLFQRRGADTFDVSAGALLYEENIGTPLDTSALGYAIHSIATPFPYYGDTYNQLYISAYRGVFFATPPSSDADQHTVEAVLEEEVPAIAPLLHPQGGGIRSETYLLERADAIVITWRAAGYEHDVQATLSFNGDIRFSYRKLGGLPWGAVVVTSGTEAWRDTRVVLGSGTDPLFDVDQAVPATYEQLDVESMQAARVGGSELLEVRVVTRSAVNQAAIPPGDHLTHFIAFGSEASGNHLRVHIEQGALFLQISGVSYPASYVRFDDRTMIVTFPESALPGPLTGTMQTTDTVTSVSGPGDEATMTTTWQPVTTPAQTDLDQLAVAATMTRPIVEVFSLPRLNETAVWEKIRAEQGLTDADVDGVAIYQTFLTDIIFYANAYATIGNAQVDGIGAGSPAQPKRPNVLHMSSTRFGITVDSEMFLLAHEFAHRWLYFAGIREDGVDTHALNPASAHPAAYVHMPAVGSYSGGVAASVMGGGPFTDYGNGTFSTPSTFSFGYSWDELYLMGLAGANEVPDWFYIAGSNPPLASEYNAPANYFGSGTRRNVSVQQIIDAQGARVPSYATSQKNFRMLIVLVERPSAPATAPIVNQLTTIRREFESVFATLTSGRGSVTTRPPARDVMAAFTYGPIPASTGTPVSFTNRTSGSVSSWSWSFGDGATATSFDATHAYSAPGVYDVTLTMGNGSVTDSITRQVVIGTANVSSASPAAGVMNGGTTVTLNGSGFAPGATLSFGGTSVAANVIDASTMTAVAPPHAKGTVDLVLTNSDGQQQILPSTFTYFGTPGSVTATAASVIHVALSWTRPHASAQFRILRRSGTGSYATVATTSDTSFLDETASPNTAYVYAIQAVDASGALGTPSAPDLTTTLLFSNELHAGITQIRALHVTQLRQAVNAARTVAGLPPFSFTGSIAAGASIKAVHLAELRTALDAARAALGLPPIPPRTITPGVIVNRLDVEHVRAGVK